MIAGNSSPTPPNPRSTPTWSLADLVDFEMLLGQDDAAQPLPWRQAWNRRGPERAGVDGNESRRALFHAWLDLRRQEPGSELPGESIAAGWRWLGTLGAVAGILLGAGVTGALLHYRGSEPVNVALFLACTLGLQWLVLLGAVAVGILRWVTGALHDLRPLRHLVSGLAWLCSAGLRRLPGEQRERLRARLAVLGRKREIYGSLTTWPILVVTQLFAVGYNLGVIGLLLAQVAATDLAFGWQSTLDLSPDAVHRLASAMAAPWAWIAPSPHPSLPQIEGSRFSYAGGIAGMDPTALASWWPFLVYSVAGYGLLVRAGLLALASFMLRRTIARWPFDHEGCNALARQLTGPVIHAQDDTSPLHIPELASPSAPPPPSGRPCLALIATELVPSVELANRLLAQAFQATATKALPVQIDHPSGNAGALQAISDSAASGDTVVVVAPAHRAPIKAIALFLQTITGAAGPKREVILLLVGQRTGASDTFAPVPDLEFQHWRNLQAIHRLPVSLERLPPS
ncbi:MAG: DUF2868 domain-containing protein [Limisphaerales bacterium]